MTGPKRLWSGDWSDESAAARARMAQARAHRATLDDEPTEPAAPPPPRPPAFAGVRRLLAATRLAAARAAARARSLTAVRPKLVPRGLRARLLLIALLAGLGGAAAMIGIEAATGAATPAAHTTAQGWLGVELYDATGEPGALVALVVPGSPAQSAGLQPGDVITEINGGAISDSSEAQSAIEGDRPGERITLGVDRVGAQLTLQATLGTRPANAP